MSDTPNDDNTRGKRPNGKRRKLVAGVLGVFLVGGIAYGAWYLLVGSKQEYTDNAYVDGNIVQITPQIAGTVIAIGADNTDAVKAGQVLVQLDPADATVALQVAEANLAKTVRQVRNLFATSSGQQANVKQRESDVARAKEDFDRRQKLATTGAVSGEEMNHARDALAAAQAALTAAREQANANRALVDRTTVEDHPDVRAAAAKVREAYLASTRTRILAPVSGIVSKRSAQLGQRVNPGAPLMAVIPVDQMWVNANFKEPQLANIHIGQPVKLTADVYGSKVEYDGKVVGLDAGTGAAFSMLPAQNATGNWIKVVQRVPVRVAIDPEQMREHPLRIGLSMEATVDVHDRSGAVIATTPRSGAAYTTPVFDTDQHDAERIIDRIVRTNANGAPGVSTQRLAGSTPGAVFHPASFTIRAQR